MTFDIVEIWGHMGMLGKFIAASLVVMAIACGGVVFERMLGLARSKRASQAFAKDVKPILDEWRLDELGEVSKKHKGSALARLIAEISEKYIAATKQPGKTRPSEMARAEAERSKEALGADLRRGMGILATTGSIAPFVGLLGTVVGIIGAFQGIANSGSGGIAAISIGISEALVETALGLLVAIPAVICFNYLNTRVASVELNMSRAAGELLDEMENRDGLRDEEKRVPEAA